MEQENKKKDKLTDKAFSRLIVTSILGIVVCIVCLCSTTYAWFADSAPSSGNEIKMAEECLLTVTAVKDGTPLEHLDTGAVLEVGATYEVTLTLPADSASGYCQITAGGQTYYTDYIVRHSDPTPRTVTFTLTAQTAQSAQNVVFTTRWGIYSGESSVVNGVLTLP